METESTPNQEHLTPQEILRSLLCLRRLPPEIASDILDALGEGKRPALPDALAQRRLWKIVRSLRQLGYLVEKEGTVKPTFFALGTTQLFVFTMGMEESTFRICLPFKAAGQLADSAAISGVTNCYRELVGKDNVPSVGVGFCPDIG